MASLSVVCFCSRETLLVAWLCCQHLISMQKLLPFPKQGKILKAQPKQKKVMMRKSREWVLVQDGLRVNKLIFSWYQLKDWSAFTFELSWLVFYLTVGSFLLGTCTVVWASWRTVCWDWTISRRATSTVCGQAMTMWAGRTRASARALLKWSSSLIDHGTSPPWR